MLKHSPSRSAHIPSALQIGFSVPRGPPRHGQSSRYNSRKSVDFPAPLHRSPPRFLPAAR